MLGIPPESLRVLSYDVGGNFGTRNRVFVEFGLALWAARKLGRPVKFTATRSETFLTDYQGRDLVTRVELALRKDGRFLAMRATNISNLGARCVSLSPLSKGAGPDPGLVRHPGSHAARHGGLHQHHADAGLPQLGPPGGDVRHRAADRHRRRSIRLRSCRAAAQEPGRSEGHALPQRGRHAVRQRPLRREHGLGDGDRRLERLRAAQARSRQTRQAPRPRPRQLRRVVDRRAERTGAHHGAARGPRRCGDRHAAERPGPRDELRPGGRRSALCSGRDRQDHPRRYRRGEGRRRLAFRPLDAPRGDGVLQGRGRSDRARQAGGRGHPRQDAGPDRVRRRTLFGARHQPLVRLPRTRPRSRASTPCPTTSRTASRSSPTTRCTSRCFPTAARSASSRSIPTPAM